MRKSKGCGCGCGVIIFLLALLTAALAIFVLNWQSIAEWFFPRDYQENVMQVCAEYEMDQWLIMAMIREESGFDPEAVSAAGARGLMQLMPETAADIIQRADYDFTLEQALSDPLCNIRCGVWYLDWLCRRCYDGNLTAAIAAYNAGRATVDGWLSSGQWDGSLDHLAGIPYAETRRYLQYVFESHDIYQRLYG